MVNYLRVAYTIVIILLFASFVSRYSNELDQIRIKKYKYCTEELKLNKYKCSIWAQFDTDWK